MKKIISSFLMATSVATTSGIAANAASEKFETVVELNQRPGNIAVSSNGEVYITMHPIDNPEAKIMRFNASGNILPVESPFLKKATSEARNIGIADAIGIFITKEDVLWILDMGGKVGNKMVSPKFVAWDLRADKLARTLPISADVLGSSPFVQDFAIDEKNGFAFIADMTGGGVNPAIIVVNLNTGEMKRVLESSKYTKTDKVLKAEGKEIVFEDGKKAKLGLNPITIDENGDWVYFGNMSQGEVYGIKSSVLEDFSLSDANLEKAVQKFGYKPHSDGFKIDANGNIYVADVDKLEIGVIKNKKYKTYISSPELTWVDGFFVAQDGYVYATVNQLNRHKAFNGQGKEGAVKPFRIIKFKQVQ